MQDQIGVCARPDILPPRHSHLPVMDCSQLSDNLGSCPGATSGNMLNAGLVEIKLDGDKRRKRNGEGVLYRIASAKRMGSNGTIKMCEYRRVKLGNIEYCP